MKRALFALAVAAAIVGMNASAGEIEGVTVTGSRIVKERIGRTPTGTPISAISLSYKVSYADLDLSTAAGNKALEQRVQEAARAACKEIGRMYPTATPDDATCTKEAVADAMVRVKEAGSARK